MSNFIDSIDYYDQILIVLFLVVGSVISQEMAGVRGECPTPFFSVLSVFLPRNSSEADERK